MFLILVALALIQVVAFSSAKLTLQLQRRSTPHPFHTDSLVNEELDLLSAKYIHNAFTFRKNTGSHDSFVNATALRKRSGAQIQTNEKADRSDPWSTVISVGFPPQSVAVTFDTSSADVIVDSSYDPDKSITSRQLDGPKPADVDDLSFGPFDLKKVAVSSSSHNSARIGLAFPSISSASSANSFTNVLSSHLDQNVYQFTLGDKHGSLNVGTIDRSLFFGNISWNAVNPAQGYWTTPFTWNGLSFHGTVDSTASVILGNVADVKRVLMSMEGVRVTKSVDGSYIGLFDCDKVPSSDFVIGGVPLKFSASLKHGTMCKIPVVGVDGLNHWILGEPIFKLTSIILDFENHRIGFAQRRTHFQKSTRPRSVNTYRSWRQTKSPKIRAANL